jgi:PAS domain S-box-containing protein
MKPREPGSVLAAEASPRAESVRERSEAELPCSFAREHALAHDSSRLDEGDTRDMRDTIVGNTGHVVRLTHELEVHQSELQAQNAELIAARVETETALERYTTLFDFAPIGYAILGDDERIVEINHAGADLLGAPRAQLAGKAFLMLVAPEYRRAWSLIAQHARATDMKYTVEATMARAPTVEGLPRRVRLTARALPHVWNRVLLAIVDITEETAREEKLAHAEAALREDAARKDDFLAMLSHELRAPLAPVRSGLAVLERAAPGDERARHALEVMDRQVSHLTRLVDDLLDVTRIARGKIELRRELIDFGALVSRSVEDHRAGIEARGIRVGVVVGAGSFDVDGDPARLVQVVSNVLVNAEKFTPPGGSIHVSVLVEGSCAVLRVRDTGPGIPTELRAHMFEPFAQAPQTLDRSRGGLGLGLAMVKGFVELHGGTVSLLSGGSGKGAEIAISLPLAAARVSPSQAPPARTGRQRRVLVVEDNEDASTVLRDELELMGNEAKTAPDGPSALALAHAFHPELVLCDIGLPGMDGYDVARAIRRDPMLRDVYMVALSGYASPEDLRRASEAGFNRHVAKPIGLEELERLMDEAPDTVRCEPPS